MPRVRRKPGPRFFFGLEIADRSSALIPVNDPEFMDTGFLDRVKNPRKYEISVFKDRKLERVLEGRNEAFMPVQKKGRGFVSTAAYIVSSGDLVFVAFQNLDPKAKKTAAVFRAGRQIGSIELLGTPYVAEEEGFRPLRREIGLEERSDLERRDRA